MASAQKPSPVKLIIGAIFASEGVLIQAKRKLVRKFGPLDFQSPIIPFDYTQYYRPEMGVHLNRQFLSFRRLINPQRLAAIKLYANQLEQRTSRTRKKSSRTINLDPGYICGSKLILASCKDFAHRIYLEKGVYAELTLQFRNHVFMSLPWTFPDYRSKEYIQFFTMIRQIYLRQLQE